jgi:copper chaperone CopZ
MTDMKKFPIQGMHCASCATLIQMNLDDAGLENVRVNQAEQTLTVPAENLPQIDLIKQAVAAAGDYELKVTDHD